MVGHGDGAHSHLFDALHQLRDLDGAIEQAVLRVHVQVDKISHDLLSFLTQDSE
jgi:hypothetical protein